MKFLILVLTVMSLAGFAASKEDAYDYALVAVQEQK